MTTKQTDTPEKILCVLIKTPVSALPHAVNWGSVDHVIKPQFADQNRVVQYFCIIPRDILKIFAKNIQVMYYNSKSKKRGRR